MCVLIVQRSTLTVWEDPVSEFSDDDRLSTFSEFSCRTWSFIASKLFNLPVDFYILPCARDILTILNYNAIKVSR
jgi:hypothetical protein